MQATGRSGEAVDRSPREPHNPHPSTLLLPEKQRGKIGPQKPRHPIPSSPNCRKYRSVIQLREEGGGGRELPGVET